MPTPQRSDSPYRKSFRFSSAYRSSRGRNEEGRPEIPHAEKPLLFALAILMVTMPWLAGIEAGWAPFASLAIAAGCFLLGLTAGDRGKHHSHTGGRSALVRLIRFPVFYAGLGLLAYVAAQGLNPAIALAVENGRAVGAEPIGHIEWLPSGTVLPEGERGPFDFLILFGTAFLAVCALWMGVTRRRSILFLCRILCINGLLLAGLGLIQTFLGAEKILWMIDGSESSFFFSSFAHKADAAAYFNLILGLTAGMALFSYYESRRRIERSSSSGVFLSFAIVLYIATLFTFSLGGFLAGTVLVASLAAAFAYPLFIERESDAKRTAFLLLAPCSILLIGYLSIGTVFDPMSRQFDNAPSAVSAQGAAEGPARAGAELFPEKWLFGWGAGSFEFKAPGIQRNEEAQSEPQEEPLSGNSQEGQGEPDEGLLAGEAKERVAIHPLEAASSSLLAIPVEFGAAGTGLLIFILGFWGWHLGRFRVWRHPLAAFILLGAFLTILPNGAAPLLRSPALFATWCLFLAIAVVILRTERLPRRSSTS